jgi:sRNA-binding regulator protein Hfq
MKWTYPAAWGGHRAGQGILTNMPGGIHMGFETSMIYTMGMALNRALENNAVVDVLVDGEWLTGSVVISDGYGVVLDNDNEHSIIKVEAISAVRIHSLTPMREGITDGVLEDFEGAMPMPGPRVAV